MDLHRWTPDILERHELPKWFIQMADYRSAGKVAFIVWDTFNKEVIHADYYKDGEYFETKTFKVKIKPPAKRIL
jgi:hypothetical protein